MTIRYLALGDSYTIGESVAESERWPVRLAALLGEEGIDVEPPVIIAQTGWTTDELAAGIDAAAPEGPFDLVSLLIGVNNQYREREAADFGAELCVLLSRAVELAGGRRHRVLVVSIPDWGVTPFAEGRDRAVIAAAIDQFNAVAADEAGRAGARFLDITPSSRRAAEEPSLVAPDGLHPSGLMYEDWARAAVGEAKAALER
jgi:lysophospholipase L1-like esterase